MIKTLLGKIDSAEFGTYPDRPFLMGLILSFSFKTGGVADAGKHTVNISPDCKWDSDTERMEAIAKMLERTAQILEDAKVNYVSELAGKPVEVTFENDWFLDFRILTEVL